MLFQPKYNKIEITKNGWYDTFDVKYGSVTLFKKEYTNFWKNAKIEGLKLVFNPKDYKLYI